MHVCVSKFLSDEVSQVEEGKVRKPNPQPQKLFPLSTCPSKPTPPSCRHLFSFLLFIIYRMRVVVEYFLFSRDIEE